MANVRTKVQPGNCGMETTIELTENEQGEAVISVVSRCEKIQSLISSLQGVNPMEVALGGFAVNPAFTSADNSRLHPGCPVPTAVIKSCEVICGLALQGQVTIEVES